MKPGEQKVYDFRKTLLIKCEIRRKPVHVICIMASVTLRGTIDPFDQTNPINAFDFEIQN